METSVTIAALSDNMSIATVVTVFSRHHSLQSSNIGNLSVADAEDDDVCLYEYACHLLIIRFDLGVTHLTAFARLRQSTGPKWRTTKQHTLQDNTPVSSFAHNQTSNLLTSVYVIKTPFMMSFIISLCLV